MDLQGGMSSRAVLDIELVDINDNAPEADDPLPQKYRELQILVT